MPDLLVALGTSREYPTGAPDDGVLVQALSESGIETCWQDWGADRCNTAMLVRSTWDYHTRPTEFRSWLQRRKTSNSPTWNDPGLMEWNMHKGYLLQLEARGVPIVPTVMATAEVAQAFEARELPWADIVVKPAISASAHLTARIASADLRKFVADCGVNGDLLVQPYMQEIEHAGEISVVAIAGVLTHAVTKVPRRGDFRVQASFGGTAEPCALNENLRKAAMRVLLSLPTAPTYARVDLLPSNGTYLLMELEAIEPALFFRHAPEAATRLARYVAQSLSR